MAWHQIGDSIGSDNGLLPIQHQAIIWTNAGLSSIESLGTNVCESLIKIQKFYSQKYTRPYRLQNGGHFVWGWIEDGLKIKK